MAIPATVAQVLASATFLLRTLLSDWGPLALWLGVLSIGSLVLVAVLLPVFVIRLPADYFTRPHHIGHGRRGWVDWVWHLGKNLLGGVFLVAGFAMLFLPGQGLLTIAIGLLLMDFPRKREMERKLFYQAKIRNIVNNMRARRGRPPLEF